MQRLLPWVPDTLSHISSLGACPTEPEAVEKRKKVIEVSREDLKLYMRFDLYMYINIGNIVNTVHVAHVYIVYMRCIGAVHMYMYIHSPFPLPSPPLFA